MPIHWDATINYDQDDYDFCITVISVLKKSFWSNHKSPPSHPHEGPHNHISISKLSLTIEGAVLACRNNSKIGHFTVSCTVRPSPCCLCVDSTLSGHECLISVSILIPHQLNKTGWRVCCSNLITMIKCKSRWWRKLNHASWDQVKNVNLEHFKSLHRSIVGVTV